MGGDWTFTSARHQEAHRSLKLFILPLAAVTHPRLRRHFFLKKQTTKKPSHGERAKLSLACERLVAPGPTEVESEETHLLRPLSDLSLHL